MATLNSSRERISGDSEEDEAVVDAADAALIIAYCKSNDSSLLLQPTADTSYKPPASTKHQQQAAEGGRCGLLDSTSRDSAVVAEGPNQATTVT